MTRRDAREARTLGLWTASWLGVLLLAGLLRLGDLSVQWPVLLVPVLWGLIALRPRRSRAARRDAATARRDVAAARRDHAATPLRTDTVAWPAVPPSRERRRRRR